MAKNHQDIRFIEISTVLYVFDENCLLPKDLTKSKPLEEIFFNNIEENFENYKRLDHRIYPMPANGKEYLHGVTKFKYGKNGDWIEYSKRNKKQKDLALIKLFTSGLYDQNEDYLFCMNHPEIRKRPIQPTGQMVQNNILGPLGPIISINSFPSCLIIFITDDGGHGMKKASFSVELDRMSKISFAKMKVNITGKPAEEKVRIAGEEIGKSMTNNEAEYLPKNPYENMSWITPNGIIDGNNPPWVPFAFNNKIIDK